jgi:hypothetical protein
MTGTIHVEELVLLSEDDLLASGAEDAKPKQYRRLVFHRNPNLIQSKAYLIPVKVPSKERDWDKNGADVGRRQSGNRKKYKARDSVLGIQFWALEQVLQKIRVQILMIDCWIDENQIECKGPEES